MATHSQSLPSSDQLLRYRIGQRIIHAVLASSFLLLLVTGILFLWRPISFLAEGGTSGILHRIGAVLFMSVPVLYLLLDRPGAKELLVDSFRYDRDDLNWLKHMLCYALGYAVGMPPQGRLNAGQKLHHAGVVILSASIVASGLFMWAAKGSLGMGGLAIAAMIHDLSMLGLTILLVGHLYFTFVYKALSAMTTGYVPRTDALIEHAKWVEETEHPATQRQGEGSAAREGRQTAGAEAWATRWTPCAALRRTFTQNSPTANPQIEE